MISLKVHRIDVLAAVTVAATLALWGGSASAASERGAKVVDADNVCFEDPARGTFCQSYHRVFNVTEAGKSGNVNMTFVSALEASYTGTGIFEGCRQQQTDRDNTHVLSTTEGDQVVVFRAKSRYAYTCEPNNQNFDCETQINYIYANGEIRRSETRFSCEEPAAP